MTDLPKFLQEKGKAFGVLYNCLEMYLDFQDQNTFQL